MKTLTVLWMSFLLAGCSPTLTGDLSTASPVRSEASTPARSDASAATGGLEPVSAPAAEAAPAAATTGAPASDAVPAATTGAPGSDAAAGASSGAAASEAAAGASTRAPASDAAAGASTDDRYACGGPDECTSTCDSGCVNIRWAKKHRDTCVNIRAFLCSCVSKTCYTDGNPPRRDR